jgi:hypothetical protein
MSLVPDHHHPEATVATPGAPVLFAVRGNPASEEVAALVAVLLERQRDAGAGARPARRPRSAWADPARVLRRVPHHHVPGPGSPDREAVR